MHEGNHAYMSRVGIITSHFPNCEVNSGYCNCKVVNHEKVFSQGKFDSSTLYFSTLYPNFIHILLIHYIILSKEILFIPKITSQNAKNPSQILKKTFASGGLKSPLRLVYLLRSEFKVVIRLLVSVAEACVRT